MNRSTHFFRGGSDRNQGLLLRLLVSLGLLLTVPGTRAATLTLRYDKTGNQSSQQTAAPAAPSILSQPGNQGVPPGGTAGFAVTVTGSLPLTYQWFFNNGAINGATKDSLLLTNFSAAQEGNYTVKISNSSGNVTTTPAKLIIDANNNGISDTWELKYFGNLDQSADGDYDEDGVKNIDEYRNGTDPVIVATNTWKVSSGVLDNPANWSLGHVPRVHEAAVISSGTFTFPTSGTFTCAADKVTVSVPYTMPAGADQTLSVSGVWTFTAAVTLVSGQTFAVTGTGQVVFAGTTDLKGARLLAYDGGRLGVPSVVNFTPPSGSSVTWETTGDRSELVFPSLKTIAGTMSPNTYVTLIAHNGQSLLSLPTLTSITKATDGDTDYNSGIRLQAFDGATLSAPLLSTFSDNDPYADSSLTASNNGLLSVPKLLAPKGAHTVNLNALSNPQQFTSLPGCSYLYINSGTVVMNKLDSIDIYQVAVFGGAKVTFPNVTSFTLNPNYDRQWDVEGDGSELIFPNLKTIIGKNSPGHYLTLIAHNGQSLLSLPTLTSITKANDGDTDYNSGIRLQAFDGATLSAPMLSTFSDNDPYADSSLTASNNGLLSVPKLLAPKGAHTVNLNALSNPQQFTSLPGCSYLYINSGTVVMNKLDSIDIYQVAVFGGAKVTFPNVTSFTLNPNYDRQWDVEGDGSELIFPTLKTIIGKNSPGHYLTLIAHNGQSLLSLPTLTSITKANDGDTDYNSGIRLQAFDGATLSAPMLSTFSDNDPYADSSLTASNNGLLSVPKLLAPKGAHTVNLNALSNPQQFTSLPGCSYLYINSGTVVMNKLDSIDIYQVAVFGGAKVTFPNVTSFTLNPNYDRQWDVEGDGSELIFPNLRTIIGKNSPGHYLTLIAHSGQSLLSLPTLTSITKATDGDTDYNSGIRLQAFDGATISAPLLDTFIDNDSHPDSSLAAVNGGMLDFPGLAQSGVKGIAMNGYSLPAEPYSVITSGSAASAIVGQAFSFNLTATNSPLRYAATGLPDNLQLNTTTGLISGTASHDGVSDVLLSVTNAHGTTHATLRITINPVAPVAATGFNYAGLVNSDGGSALDVGSIKFTFNASGTYTVQVVFGGKTFSSIASLDKNTGSIPKTTFSTGLAAVIIDPAWSTGDQIIGTATRANGNVIVPFVAFRCPYSAGNPLPLAFQGKYTAKLPLQSSSGSNPTLRGAGYMTLTVTSAGTVVYAGKAPDGTAFAAGAAVPLDLNLIAPLYTPLYAAKGAIIGMGRLETKQQTDLDGNLNWFRPSAIGSALFAAGWPRGLSLSLTGSRYTPASPAKGTTPAVLPLPHLPTVDADGNVTLYLGLGGQYITRKFKLSPTGVFTEVTLLAAGEKLSLTLTPLSGLLTGTYQENATAKPFSLSGVLLQKTDQAFGFALSPTESAILDLEVAP